MSSKSSLAQDISCQEMESSHANSSRQPLWNRWSCWKAPIDSKDSLKIPLDALTYSCRLQLRLYLQRKLAQYILTVQDDPIHEMIFIALKGILTNQASLTNELNHPLTARMAAMEQNQEAMMEKLDFLAEKIGAIASGSSAVVEAKSSRRDGGKAGCGQKEVEDDASWVASRNESLSAGSVGLIMQDEPPGNGRAGSPVSVFHLDYVDQ